MQSLVPPELAGLPLAEFLDRLPELDAEFAEQVPRRRAGPDAALRGRAAGWPGERRRAAGPAGQCTGPAPGQRQPGGVPHALLPRHAARPPGPRGAGWRRRRPACIRISWRWGRRWEVEMSDSIEVTAAADCNATGEPHPKRKIKVGILGATGAVGQRFVQLLADHPWFEIGCADRIGSLGRQALRGCVPSGCCAAGCRRRWPTWCWCRPSRTPSRPRRAAALLGAPGRHGRRRSKTSWPGRLRRLLECVGAPDGCRRAAADPRRQPRPHRPHPGSIGSDWRLASVRQAAAGLHRHQPQLHHHPPGLRAEAAARRLRPGRGQRGDDAGDLGRGLSRACRRWTSWTTSCPYIGGEEEKIEIEPRKLLGQLAGDAIEFADFLVSAQATGWRCATVTWRPSPSS